MPSGVGEDCPGRRRAATISGLGQLPSAQLYYSFLPNKLKLYFFQSCSLGQAQVVYLIIYTFLFLFLFFFTIKLSSTVVSSLTDPESTKHEGEIFWGILSKLLQPEWAELPLITRAASVVIRTRLRRCQRLFQGTFATSPPGRPITEPSRDLSESIVLPLPSTGKFLPKPRDLCDHSTTSPFS